MPHDPIMAYRQSNSYSVILGRHCRRMLLVRLSNIPRLQRCGESFYYEMLCLTLGEGQSALPNGMGGIVCSGGM